jgi:hypothetical protein
MAYAQFGQIQAVDFNTLTGGPTSTTANTLNATWATGTSSAGYGQTAVANVTAGGTVAASNWNQLVVATANAAAHQGSSITTVAAPVSGGTVSFLSAIPTNLQTIYTNRLNALAQGSSTSNAVVRTTSWTASLTFTQTVTFANATAARHFFNSGGQIKLQTQHDSTINVQNSALRTLAIATGTVVLSSVTSGSANIAGTAYNGVTKVGGSGSATIATNTGYYALTTTPAQLFRQNSTTTGYTSSTITYNAAVNSNILTITTVVDIEPDSSMEANRTTVTLQAFFPSTTYLANTWGAVTLSGSVTGS